MADITVTPVQGVVYAVWNVPLKLRLWIELLFVTNYRNERDSIKSR